MKILIVDDQSINRSVLRWILEDDGHQVCEAENGKTAVEKCQATDFDLVLMDVIMPIMDGLTAAKEIKRTHRAGDIYLPIIFLTALDDEDTLSKCLESGGDDFLNTPYSQVILKSKIRAHSRIRELTRDVSQKNQVLERFNSHWERERNIVSHIFNKSLEHNLNDSDSIRTHIQPASSFNGDIVLSAPSLTGGLYVFIGDFTGHGLAASIGTLPLVSRFNELARRHLSVGEIAYQFNQMLKTMLPDYMFCCANIIELNPEGDSVQMWLGGLPDGYLISKDGAIKERFHSHNMPLGIEDDDNFNKGFVVKYIEPHDKILFMSDGVSEAQSQLGEFFGEQRIEEMVANPDGRSFFNLLQALNEFTQDAEQADDITLVEITGGPVVIKASEIISVHERPSYYEGILWSLNCHLSEVDIRQGEPIEEVMSVLGAQTVLRPYRDLIGLLISELYSNALEHGILNLDSKLKNTPEGFIQYYEERNRRIAKIKNASIRLSLQLKKTDEVYLNIVVADSGSGFDTSIEYEKGNEDTFGRGLGLIHKLCSRVEYRDNGATADVDFPLRSEVLNYPSP
ncbi:SpoIIE family protein phosphatase [Bermanella sp. R86510]|uniref:SpoIIE family protein phosphatase n=1 Tax=unclassified Bermanella TaxID=2627862 RepID=UPI0037C73AE0